MPSLFSRLFATHLFRGFCLAGLLAIPAASAQDDPPPRADQYDELSEFLACSGNAYALCYYSGPEEPTPPGRAQRRPCRARSAVPSMPTAPAMPSTSRCSSRACAIISC